MKVVIASDFHPDHVTHGVSRFAEMKEAVHRTVDAAIEEQAALYVFAGDLCDPDSGSVVFRCVELLISAAMRLQERGIEFIAIAGNHDVIEDGTGDTTLSPLRALQHKGDGLIRVYERPGIHVVSTKTSGFNVISLPYAATSHAYDVEATIADLARGTRPESTIVVAHLNIAGVVPGEETTEMPRGREIRLPVEAAHRVAKHVVGGHYHRRQRTKDGVWIPGSLARLTFGEEGNEPSFLMLEV